MAARLVGITYYPVKGCAGTPLTEAALTRTGLLNDRAYAIADENGDLRWQWGDPQLAVITPELTDDTGELVLTAPARSPVKVKAEDSGPEGGAEVNAWLTDVLGAPSTLVRPPAGNSNRLHVVSLSSLDALNHRITERGAAPVPLTRFRPNLVVDGWPTPDRENGAASLSIAGAELTYTEETVRCAITMVDQSTGRRAGPEPLRTLADHRRTPDGGVVFGAYFAVRREGRVSVGDEVRVPEENLTPATRSR